MQLEQVLNIIEELAPPRLAEDWDKSGIQVASTRKNIERLAISLDPTPENVALAAQFQADILLTHHPLSLSPQYPDRLDAHHFILSRLLTSDILHYAAHTSLDGNPLGPVNWLADDLHLQNREVLEPNGSVKDAAGREIDAGFGCVGDLPQALGLDQVAAPLRRIAPGQSVLTYRLIGQAPEKISRIAFCPGSGSSMLAAAAAKGAQLFITGDLKYHQSLDLASQSRLPDAYPRLDLALLDVTHFSLEEEMMRRLADILKNRLPALEIRFLTGRNPFQPLIPIINPEEKP